MILIYIVCRDFHSSRILSDHQASSRHVVWKDTTQVSFRWNSSSCQSSLPLWTFILLIHSVGEFMTMIRSKRSNYFQSPDDQRCLQVSPNAALLVCQSNFKELLKHLERDFATQLVQTSRRLQKAEHGLIWDDCRVLWRPSRGKTGRPCKKSRKHVPSSAYRSEGRRVLSKGLWPMAYGWYDSSPRKMHQLGTNGMDVSFLGWAPVCGFDAQAAMQVQTKRGSLGMQQLFLNGTFALW